ncbi:MAG: DUF3194 domain-containing protein [Candidatus Bathyarchaeia archaeon]
MSLRLIDSLSYEELEKICEIAERAARKYITSKVPEEYISDLSISVDLEGSDTLNVDIEVELTLSPLCRNVDADDLAKESVRVAFEAIEKYLEEVRSKQLQTLKE